MKRDYCDKCRNYDVIEEHHILPKATFGKNDEIAKLCPNCHAKFHEFLGKKNLKNPDMVFHFATFYKWLAGLLPILLLIWWLFSNKIRASAWQYTRQLKCKNLLLS